MSQEHEEAELGEQGESALLVELPGTPVVLPREQHPISRKLIDADALKVMYRLNRNGFLAFLVGGGVRDLLLGKQPKDFDISTDARPEAVRHLFRNSRIIGRRFRLNHVFFKGNKIIEVSTFRAASEDDSEMLSADNTYGTPETDAIRRDLTINGLFYDPRSFSVIDYVGGIEDLRAGLIRTIGDPLIRFQQDPVRMIRAVRHAARNGFVIEPETFRAIGEHKELIRHCPPSRIHEELMREFHGGYALESLRLLKETGLLAYLVPELDRRLDTMSEGDRRHFDQTLGRIDSLAAGDVEVSTAVLFLALSVDYFAQEKIAQAGGVGAVIESLYHDVGLTRREREEMEHIVPLAHQLFGAYDSQDRRGERLLRRPLMREALALIELTANNDDGYACVAYWRNKLAKQQRSHGRSPWRRR